ncbi:uncharacterized protein DC041_0009948 [Schistosoma bovis]|uniref:Uncharacterized protein n=1 Tax=Schistosoma bovis TaxID=6184 RepID=A0A430QL66_SCHBO|nr:uncharacterized protein DC041_0009948 [Schistosoma bovis]
MWLSKTISIDRSHHTDAISAMEKAAIEAKQDKDDNNIVYVCFYNSATYKVKVLPKIDTKGMNKSQVDQLLNETRERMVAAFEMMKGTISN